MSPPTNGRGFSLVRGEGEAAASASMYVYDLIGVDPWTGGGISAKKVIDDLAALAGVTALDVRVNSPGGDVFEGIAIYNSLTRFAGDVTVHVDGLAASAASIVAMAGGRTLVAENAMMMIHRPWTTCSGDAADMKHTAATLEKAWTGLLATYARRTGRRAATFEQRVADAGGEWWLTAEEAVAEGLADGVETPPGQGVKAFGLSRFQRVPERLAASAEKDAAAPRHAAPSVLEIATPRVVRVDRAAARRREVELLRAQI